MSIMNTKNIPACLEPLIQYANGLTERFDVTDLRQRLEALNISVEDLAEHAISDDNGYRRNLVYECEMADFLLLYWKSGQRSPIHNHAGSTCGFKVLKGTGMETVFDMTPCGQVVATRTSVMNEGYICAAQDSDIHQVSNLQAPGNDLITLHIYSPPLRVMDQYSITGGPVERYQPTIFEHADGSGI